MRHITDKGISSSRSKKNAISTYLITNYLILLLVFSSCFQQQEQQVNVTHHLPPASRLNSVDLPPPIKAKYVDLDSVNPPILVPLKGKPKVVLAHPNVYPIGTPEVIEIPEDDLKIVRPGKDGIPLPMIIPAKIKVVPALQPKPIPASAARFTDDAVFNINFLSEEQGLQAGTRNSQSGDMVLLEDSKGNIWIGGEVAVRYDGVNFYHYTAKEGFLAGGIHSIMEDRKGNIWFTGQAGICYYDGHQVTYLITDSSKPNYRDRGCLGILEDRKGNIWFGNKGEGKDNNGVYCFDGENFTIFKKEQGIFNETSKYQGWGTVVNEVTSFYEDSQGYIWWMTNGNGVLRYDRQHIIHYSEQEGLVNNYISDIIEDDDGNIWFSSNSINGLSCYKRDRNSPLGKGGTFTNYTNIDGLNNEFGEIIDLIIDEKGHLWMSTYEEGIYRFDGVNFTQYKTTEGLGANKAYGLLLDRENNIWISTSGDRLCQFKPNSFSHFTEKQGLSSNVISSIIEDKRGNIWIGTWNNGVVKYDGTTFTHFTEKEGLLSNVITWLYEDSKGAIWMSTFSKGISKFDEDTFTHYTPEQGLGGNWWWDLVEDEQGQIWVACGPYGGVNRLHPETGRITQFTNISNVKSANNYDGDMAAAKGLGYGRMLSDSRGTLWIGTMGWIAKHDPALDQITFIAPVDRENEGLKEGAVVNLLEDDKDNLWFGSATHFIKMKKDLPDNTTIPQVTFGNGLPNHLLRTVEVDRHGNIWFMGEGLGVIPNGWKQLGSSNLDWFHFQKSDGLKSMNSHINGSCLDSKNRLWFGSDDGGVAIVDLHTFELPQKAPNNLSLSHIDLQGQFLDYRNLSDSLYQTTFTFGEIASQSFDSVAAFHNYPEYLNLPFDLNHLTFHFSSKDWSASHKIQYSYQMEGLEKAWSQPTAETKADYRNLPNGTYTFKVKAIGAAHIWSDVFEFPFTIRPPWWRTWVAYALYTLLSIVLLYQIYQFQLNRQLEKAEAYRLRELDAVKTKLYTNITHEFRTPLTIIKGMAEQLKKQGNYKMREGLQMIRRNADSLLQLVNQLLDLQKIESGTMQVHLVQGDIIAYLKYLISSFRLYAESKNIRLHFYSDLETFSMDYDSEKIKHIISNLLSNAIKFTPEGGDVYIAIDLPPSNATATFKFFILKIRDTGQGISEDQLPFIFDRFYQVEDDSTRTAEGTGIGLALVKQLVELLEGTITVESKLGKGTSFNLQLPITQLATVKQEGLKALKKDTGHFIAPLASTKVVSPNPTNTNSSELPLVLIVEDNLDMQRYLQSCLKNKYRLEIANNGKEGIDKALELIPDLIISDVMMPDTDGYMLCDRLKKEDLTSHIPIILLTAKGDQDSKMEGFHKGADAYMIKPFEEKELLVRLAKLIELRQQLQTRYAKHTFQIKPATKKEDEFVLKVRQIILDQLGDDSFGIAQLCSCLSISRPHLHRKLKALTGKTTSHFIRQIRLQEAQKLLATPTLSISEIAYAVGFKDPSYFTSVFKEHFGVSPSEMRDSQN